MKIILILALASTFVYSQSIYQVEPGMKGNKIILTIENASTSLSIEELKIIETNHSELIEMKVDEFSLSNLEENSEREIEIEFDVMNKVKINEKDTLNFQITDNNGQTWSKEIVLEYTPPKTYALFQNYPNPFNPSTTIKYSIPSVQTPLLRGAGGVLVTIKIYDILGREVATPVNEKQQPGNYEIVFNAQNLASGTYFYRLATSDFSKVMKLILLK